MMSMAPERVDLFLAKAKSEMAPKNDFAMMRCWAVVLTRHSATTSGAAQERIKRERNSHSRRKRKCRDCEIAEKFLFEVANPWIFSPQTQFEVARLPQKWEYPMGAL